MHKNGKPDITCRSDKLVPLFIVAAMFLSQSAAHTGNRPVSGVESIIDTAGTDVISQHIKQKGTVVPFCRTDQAVAKEPVVRPVSDGTDFPFKDSLRSFDSVGEIAMIGGKTI